MRTFLRIVSMLAVALAAFSLSVATAAAANGNAHFVKASASASGSSLTVTFKEAGLSSGSVETVTASAHWSAQFACFNNGGKHPSATNKETTDGDSSTSGQFTADRNGNINGSLTVTAPSVSTNDFSCPSGQTEVLTYIQWSNITLSDETSGAFTTVPGTFTFGAMV
jgi:hypothetical protein